MAFFSNSYRIKHEELLRACNLTTPRPASASLIPLYILNKLINADKYRLPAISVICRHQPTFIHNEPDGPNRIEGTDEVSMNEVIVDRDAHCPSE